MVFPAPTIKTALIDVVACQSDGTATAQKASIVDLY